MKIRTFLALKLPKFVIEKLSAYAERFSGYEKLQQIRWLPKENYHLTLTFLGNIEEDLISNLQHDLEQNLSYTKAIFLAFQKSLHFHYLVLQRLLQP